MLMIKPKVALITGITGQDGAYPPELLLSKGYVVHGIKRRTSLFNTDRIDHLYQGRGGDEIGTAESVQPVRGEIQARCKPGQVIVRVDPRYYRPTEVETLPGDASRAHRKPGWKPTTTLADLVRKMTAADFDSARRDSLVKQTGFKAYDYHE